MKRKRQLFENPWFVLLYYRLFKNNKESLKTELNIYRVSSLTSSDMDVKIDNYNQKMPQEIWKKILEEFKVTNGISYEDFTNKIPEKFMYCNFYTISTRGYKDNNLSNEYRKHYYVFEYRKDNDGEITPEIEENLKVAKGELSTKIKNYVQAIKILENDQSLIKEEIDRLKGLYDSKNKTIERLKNIILTAIENFGDITKNGSKFIDYGLGKVSVRTSQVVQVDDEEVDSYINKLFRGLNWYSMNNQLDTSITSVDDILEFANSSTNGSDYDKDKENLKLYIEDLSFINSSIDVKINILDMLETNKGRKLIKALLEINNFNVKCKVDKKAIKDNAKMEFDIPSYAKIVDSKTLNIK